jgi:hypothetical protein
VTVKKTTPPPRRVDADLARRGELLHAVVLAAQRWYTARVVRDADGIRRAVEGLEAAVEDLRRHG